MEAEVAPMEPDSQYDESDELSRLRRISKGGSSNAGNFEWDLDSPPSGRRHLYVAAGVIIVVLALIYMAWHGSLAAKNAHQASAAPPVALSEPERVPNGNADTPDATALRTQPTAPLSAPKSAKDAAANDRHQAAADRPPDEQKGTAPQPVMSGNGAEELALAQRYLSGGTGLQRNSEEAAQWLWKSVAKHNAEAPLLLADLYLRGDGVSKNCDQARVLLDSAARKGISGAAERLRNLQAFGCQ
jgi:TPR repeat protein